jgi:hypothetical protein
MSTTEITVDREIPVANRPGPVPRSFQLETITDPKAIVEILYRTSELTDNAFIALVDDIGMRAARLILRAKAVGGDIRAIDLYLRIAREDKEKRERMAIPAERQVGESFTPKPRDD